MRPVGNAIVEASLGKGRMGTDPGLNSQRGGGSSAAVSISWGGRMPG